MELSGTVVLVTGSSRGIGRAIAERFARSGANIVINASRSTVEARKTLAGLPRYAGQEHLFIKADVADPRQIKSMMAIIGKKFGRLNILINNAGLTEFIEHSDLKRLTPDLFDIIYKTHLRGSFLCVREALPLLKKSTDAQVINISSIAALTAVGSNIAYCAMKAALVNMTVSLARALAPKIRVNAVSPGLTETGLIKGWSDYREEQIKKTPLGRLGRPEDVADCVFTVAVNMKYVTGQNIVVDGGRTIG